MDTTTTIEFDPDFSDRVKGYRILVMEADVKNSPTSDSQRAEMDALAADIASTVPLTEINHLTPIAATRAAYKACGKEPNRYRPSQEQLMRRIVRGLGLYNVSALVDAGNQLSLMTRCAVGCFDAAKVDGRLLRVGVGREGEPYTGIGRGELNIAGMPIVRDATGGIGTPTSDNERTKLSPSTTSIIVTVHLFDPTVDADRVVSLFTDLFTRHGSATSIRHTLFTPAK